MSWWNRIVTFLDWKANPVLVRDLRLYMRGRVLVSSYFLTLAILVLGGIAYAVTARQGGLDGNHLLSMPTYLLAVICGALIPNLVGERFRAELSSRATELALVSPLSPARLVRGKWLGAFLLCLVVVSLAMPVFATAYLLGGVGPWQMLGVIAGVLLAGAVMPLPQLYLATAGKRPGMLRIMDGLIFVGELLAMLFVYAPLLLEAVVDDLRWHGITALTPLLSMAIAAVLIAQFLYFVTVSRLRGVAENREFAPRFSLAFAALAGGVSAYFMITHLDRSLHVRGTLAIVSLAMVFVAFAFCWGMYILCHGNAATPTRALAGGGRLRRWLAASGPDSLAAYFLVASFPILLAGAWGLWTEDGTGDRWEFICALLAPFTGIAYGLVGYHWFWRKRMTHPRDALLANVVLVINIVLAIPVYLGLQIYMYSNMVNDPEWVLGLLPTGQMYGMLRYKYDSDVIGTVGLLTLAALFVLLLPAAARAWVASGSTGDDGAS